MNLPLTSSFVNWLTRDKPFLWRERYVTSRRHPLAWATYLLVSIFGLLFVLDFLTTDAIFDTLNPLWRYLWEYELLVGGAVAFSALVRRPKVYPHWPDLADVLRFEGLGALVSGLGMVTYGVVLLNLLGLHSYSWTLMAVLGAGLIARGVQAIMESGRVEQLGALNEAAKNALAAASAVREHRGPYNPEGEVVSMNLPLYEADTLTTTTETTKNAAHGTSPATTTTTKTTRTSETTED